MSIKEEFLDLLLENKFNDIESCSKEESEKFIRMLENSEVLPENIIYNGYDDFLKIKKSDLTDKQMTIFILLKQTQILKKIEKYSPYLKTIKNCLIYFVILSIISIISLIIIGVIFGVGLIK